MQLLSGAVRNYPWGSRTAIASLAGRATPTEQPEAELWFGAHPGAPSTLADGATLLDLINADPETNLGAQTVAAYGPQLPFLMKILAAAQPLSIQAHPSKLQAEEGCALEDAAGIDRAAPNRNYRDDNHKPELIVALTPFRALAGFRPLADTLALLESFQQAEVERYLPMLSREPAAEGDDLRALFTTWISVPREARVRLIDAVIAGARFILPTASGWQKTAAETILSIAERYPNDVGILAATLLNVVDLQPGEALFLAAGQLHAYVEGLGVEIMANSDNVLRGGLTSKHVDVPELVKVTHFESLTDPRVPVQQQGSQAVRYPVPISEFQLTRVDVQGAENYSGGCLAAGTPRILVCTAGEVRASSAAGEQLLAPTQGLWVPAAEGDVTLAAVGDRAQVFVATVDPGEK